MIKPIIKTSIKSRRKFDQSFKPIRGKWVIMLTLLLLLNESGIQAQGNPFEWVRWGTADVSALWGDRPLTLTLDAGGNCFVAGSFLGSLAFGSTAISTPPENGVSESVFLAKWTPQGSLEWLRALHPKSNRPFDFYRASVELTGEAVDPSGSSFLTGYFSGKLVADSIELTAQSKELVLGQAEEDFLVKFGPDGDLRWAIKLKDTGGRGGIAADGLGNVYLLSTVSVAKIDSNGSIQWIRTFGRSGQDRAWAITASPSGECYLAGRFASPAKMGERIQLQAGDFIAKLSPQGDVLWAKSQQGVVAVAGLALDRDGNVFMAGKFGAGSGLSGPRGYDATDQKTATFGGTTLLSQGGRDIFLCKYGSDGVFQWVQRAGNDCDDDVNGLSLDAEGNCYIVGRLVRMSEVTQGYYCTTAEMGSQGILANYSSQGRLHWLQDIGHKTEAIAVDAQGFAFIAGSFAGGGYGDGSLCSAHWLQRCGEIFIAKREPKMPPEIVTQPADQTAFYLGSVKFSMEVRSIVPYSFQWFKDGKPIASQTNSTFSIALACKIHSGLVGRKFRRKISRERWFECW